jgi:hypothetical protein
VLDIRLIRYEFYSKHTIRLKRELPSSTLRGAFGYALMDILTHEPCLPDERQRMLLFNDLFAPETELENGELKAMLRPFVIRGGYLDETYCRVGMELLLFGEAGLFEPLVDRVAEQMARRGLGAALNRDSSCCVKKLSSDLVEASFPPDVHRIVVDYLSPARIKYAKNWCRDEVPFPALISRLCDRFAELVQTYGKDDGRDWEHWCVNIKQRSKYVMSVKADGALVPGRRRSSRTGHGCSLNGFVGQMVYQGNFEPFSEILGYLPFIHVGKSAPFGCGWVMIECFSLE